MQNEHDFFRENKWKKYFVSVLNVRMLAFFTLVSSSLTQFVLPSRVLKTESMRQWKTVRNEQCLSGLSHFKLKWNLRGKFFMSPLFRRKKGEFSADFSQTFNAVNRHAKHVNNN